MSILLYAKAPQVRQSIAAALPGGAAPPAVSAISKYSEALAALVPAEALALHAAILGFTTSTTNGTTTITDSAVLAPCFWSLLALSAMLYIAGAWKTWSPIDFLKLAIPPTAFFLWMMLQRSTALDAVAPSWSANARQAAGLLGAAVLGGIATLVAYKANG